MNLTEQPLNKDAYILEITSRVNECRMHGIRQGGLVKVICRYRDTFVAILNFRETVTIPKSIADDIIVR